MAKIIKIEESIVSLENDDGTIRQVRLENLNFAPIVGDEVEVLENNGNIIVTKKEIVIQEPIPEVTVNEVVNQPVEEDKVHVITNSNNEQMIITEKPNQDVVIEVNKDGETQVVKARLVKKITYCLLALLLGFIGGHKFYAKKTKAGFLYLLFSWTVIPFFFAFVELMHALMQKADPEGKILV